jgi:hypothetical protein
MSGLPFAVAVISVLIACNATLEVGDTITPSDGGPSVWAQSSGNAVNVGSSIGNLDDSHQGRRNSATVLTQSVRAPVCQWENITTRRPMPCPGDPVAPVAGCSDGTALPPLWQRTRADEGSAWSAWEIVGPATCAAPAQITPAMVLAEFRRLPLAPSGLVVEPDRSWALVGKPAVVHADPAAQTLVTTILGTAVTITATPTAYAWDFGDGATLTTADPGRPWPDGNLGHAYTRTGTYTITLTTSWSATYTVAGDATVRDVPGTATTTSTSDPLTVEERRAHLVAGTCAVETSGGGCP